MQLKHVMTAVVLIALAMCGVARADAQPALVADLTQNVSDHEKLMFTCLHGLANCQAPRVYLKLMRADTNWLQWYLVQ